jgi:hypothetical protein
MYNLNEISTTERQNSSPYISYGSNQILKINDIELKVSANTGSPKAILHMETKPITDSDFTPIEGHKGKVGKIAIGIYMKTEDQKKDFLKKLKTISIALGLEDEVNQVTGNSFEEVVDNVKSVICGNKWARYTIFAEQYPKADGKLGIKLLLPRYNFVESIDVDPEVSKLVKFDENNNFHFKKVENLPQVPSVLEGTDDLPF